jgi:hypothetical protein
VDECWWTYVQFLAVWKTETNWLPMKLRGLFPSLGAGGSLIAAAVCAFAVLSGVLAFRGENPGTAQANSGDVVVPDRSVRTQTSSPGVLDTVAALAQTGQQQAARDQRRREPRELVRRSERRFTPRGGTTPAAPAPTDTPTAGGRTTPPAAAPAPESPNPNPPAAPGTPELPSVQHTVEQTRGAVQPVVDTVPEPVRAPVNRVVDTVEDVAGTVDETVNGLTGPLLP